MNTETIDSVLARIRKRWPSYIEELPAPAYISLGNPGPSLGLATVSMERNVTDEGWQIFQGLEAGGYNLCGYGLDPQWAEITTEKNGNQWLSALRTCGPNCVNVRKILEDMKPRIVVLNDKREWEGKTAGGKGFDNRETFTNVEALKERPDIWKGTILKDAQSNPAYHRQSADEIGCHFWIIYYHPRIVKHLAPFVRPQHLIRTYHTLDSELVGNYFSDRSLNDRKGALLSGAVSGAYPLRMRLARALRSGSMPYTEYLPHPGYHRNGCATPAFLELLQKVKVSICTSSIYGYALRKIIESTACGCVVLTDLPSDDVLPEIDGNLVRIKSDTSVSEVNEIVQELIKNYNPDRQAVYAEAAKKRYDYRVMGVQLARDIEDMRVSYNG